MPWGENVVHGCRVMSRGVAQDRYGVLTRASLSETVLKTIENGIIIKVRGQRRGNDMFKRFA